jgi:histidine triad (HIT) family protein
MGDNARVWTHEPPGYDCPFCRLQHGVHDERNQAGDVIAVTELAYARISPKWWPGNAGAALVIPRAHVENLYDVPSEVGHAIWDLTALVARTMRSVYDCDGTSTRQHNEPTGNQDVWHLHVHVFPRYPADGLYVRDAQATYVDKAARTPYAELMAAKIGLPRNFMD